MAPPVWLDNNILVNIEKGLMNLESTVTKLRMDGHELLIPKSVEHEFLNPQPKPGKPAMSPAQLASRKNLLTRFGIKVDMMANQVPLGTLRGWQNAALNDLSIPDASAVAQVRAGGQARNITNPIFLTKDAGGTLGKMRRHGVMAVDNPLAIQSGSLVSTPKAPPPPRPSFIRRRINVAKFSIKHGIKGAFSASNLASMLPEVILAIADRAAAKEAFKKIQTKFLKEGFAKGVAAGVMGWTEAEVRLELKNRITPFRVQGMEDPAGFLTREHILKTAEACENYGVEVGFLYSEPKSNDWKQKMRSEGFSILLKYNYHFPDNPNILFEYEFIDKLAFALHAKTDAIVEPAIRFD